MKYTYTRLPQSFADNPTIFTHAIMNCLADFQFPHGSQLIVYIDDLLIASENKKHKHDSLVLLHFLWKTGNKVSKHKLQWVQQEVNYLGHILTAAGNQIPLSRK